MSTPGWYPDPFGNAGLWRWFDGLAWSAEHTAARPQSRRAFPTGYRVHYRPPSHGFHAALSILTLGLWIPVWMASAGGRYRIRRVR